tara:strand:+ start:67 stop:798 length:732 start_codon:yes stop_codon:yes gene_type:complete
MSLIARSREMAKKREEKEKSKKVGHKYSTLVYNRGDKDVVYRKKDGKYYRVKDDGTLTSAPAGQRILDALNIGPSHRFISLPSASQKKKPNRINILNEIKSLNKSIKGQAQASTLTGSDKKGKETKTLEELPKKRPDRKLKKLETKDVKTFETKKAKPIEKKKDSASTTPNLKPFQGSYNQDTQKLVNIEGKTFVAPKSYEKPKSKTNPSFKRLLDKLGLNKGSYVSKPKIGHTDYRKSGLFK